MAMQADLKNYTIDSKRDRATGIRLPQSLHDQINELAEKQYRTFNSMVVYLLYKGLKKPTTERMFLRIYRKILDVERKIKKQNGIARPSPYNQEDRE